MREPDLVGSCGRAWLYPLPKDHDKPANIATWLVHRPGLHPQCSWWLVNVVSLEDIPGVESAYKAYPEAEYELNILAIDPTTMPKPEPDAPEGYDVVDLFVAQQFHGLGRMDASRVSEMTVKSIITSKVLPDQDFRFVWGMAINANVDHLKQGKNRLN